MNNLVLYTNGCPKCVLLKGELDNKGIQYKVIDNFDDVFMVAQEKGIMSMPFVSLDGEFMTFDEFKPLLEGK